MGYVCYSQETDTTSATWDATPIYYIYYNALLYLKRHIAYHLFENCPTSSYQLYDIVGGGVQWYL